jgi:hypothetical protein
MLCKRKLTRINDAGGSRELEVRNRQETIVEADVL